MEVAERWRIRCIIDRVLQLSFPAGDLSARSALALLMGLSPLSVRDLSEDILPEPALVPLPMADRRETHHWRCVDARGRGEREIWGNTCGKWRKRGSVRKWMGIGVRETVGGGGGEVRV